MNTKKQKLELTWIGKDAELKLEPRILIEDPSKSHGDKSSENMLIHGDNLLALKALEQDFAGRIKCIYIDPPYNTGSAFEHYDDNLEHSTWLNLMRPRLELLKRLLHPSGSIMVHIDYIEQAYLKVLMDEVFERKNFIQMIAVKTSTPAGFKVANPGPVNVTEYILIYARDRSSYNYKKLYVPCGYQSDYDSYILNPDEPVTKWRIEKIITYAYKKLGVNSSKELKEKFGDASHEIVERVMAEFALDNANSVFATYAPHKPSGILKKMVEESRVERDKIFHHERDGEDAFYVRNGRLFAFYSKKIKIIDTKPTPTQLLTDFWTDLSWDSLSREGGVEFKNGKKPEQLIKRILEMATADGDIVLDSFLGSGTTAAVAHKMNRRWIGIELGEHANTHCLPRIKAVVDGSDQNGISKSVNWLGGGGFKFYNLAPSLLRKDSFGNFVIDENYNANMLATAMCKHEGFKFYPDETLYWKHGKSTETDFIFVTTGFITAEQLDKIHSEMKADESLLICAKSFAPECENRFANITIKKIPQMILGKCEFAKDHYDLNIIQATKEEVEESNEE